MTAIEERLDASTSTGRENSDKVHLRCSGKGTELQLTKKKANQQEENKSTRKRGRFGF